MGRWKYLGLLGPDITSVMFAGTGSATTPLNSWLTKPGMSLLSFIRKEYAG